MNLVWFLTIGAVLATILGELGRFPFGSPGAVGVGDVLLFLAELFLLIWQVGIIKKPQLFKGWQVMVGFWVVGLLSLIISRDLGGVAYLLRFIIYSSSVWLGYSLVKSKIVRFSHISNLIILTGGILAVLGFLQLLVFPDLSFLSDFGFDPHKNRLTSTFLDPNFMGAYLSIGALMSLSGYLKERDRKYLFTLLIIASAIVLTFSRSAYLFTFVEFFFYCLFRFRRLLLVLVAGIIILYLALPPFSQRIQGALSVDKSANERVISWRQGWEIFSSNPVLGVGFNNLRAYSEKKNLFKVFSDNGGHSGAGVDSSLLFILVTTGAIGFLTFLIWWGYLFKSAFKKPEFFMMICLSGGLMVDSLFVNSLFYPPIMLLIYLLWGSII